MIKSVNIKFEKLLHDTGKAILVRINGIEHWLPKRLCRKLIVNKKLGGNVCIPTFLAERIGFCIEDCNPDVEVVHHIPEAQDKSKIKYDADLFR
jgi:hypothetical protein